jgi:hypothetical protein
MQIKIKVQSFGDIITNSSSEVYTMYDRAGVESVKYAVEQLIKAINPDINIDDHLTIDLVPSDMEIYDDADSYISFDEFYDKKFNEWCLDKSNEDILFGFPNWLKEFERQYRTDDNGLPLWTIEIKSITDLGEKIARSVDNILYAFDHEEVYC